MQHLKFSLVLAAAFGVLGNTAYASPVVRLHLTDAVVGHDSNGNKTLEPITADTQLKPGQTIEYDVVAQNAGTSPAIHLAPLGKIPEGTSYEGGTASSNADLVAEFSIDGGKTWSKSPMVKVVTPTGTVEKKADPATYTAIRWMMTKPLAAKSTISYSYEVRVK